MSISTLPEDNERKKRSALLQKEVCLDRRRGRVSNDWGRSKSEGRKDSLLDLGSDDVQVGSVASQGNQFLVGAKDGVSASSANKPTGANLMNLADAITFDFAGFKADGSRVGTYDNGLTQFDDNNYRPVANKRPKQKRTEEPKC